MRLRFLLTAIFLTGCVPVTQGNYEPSRYAALSVELGQLIDGAESINQAGDVPRAAERRSVSEEEQPRLLSASAFRSFNAHTDGLNSLDVSSRGVEAYSGGNDGTVKFHRIVRGADGHAELSSKIIYRSSEPIFAVRLNPDKRLLAVAQNGLVFVIDTLENRIIHRMARLAGRIGTLAWDPKGDLLAIGRSNGEVLVWNIKGGREGGQDDDEAIENYRGMGSPVIAIAFHPQGRVFFAAHRDGAVYLWRLIRTEFVMGIRDDEAVRDLDNRGSKNLVISGINARIEDISMRADGKYLLVSTNDGRILTVKVRGLVARNGPTSGTDVVSSLRTLYLDKQATGAKAASATGVIAAAYRDRQLRFWCLESLENRLLATSPPLSDAVEKLAASTSSSYLWAGQKSGNLLVFDADFLMRSPILSSELRGCSRLVLNEAG